MDLTTLNSVTLFILLVTTLICGIVLVYFAVKLIISITRLSDNANVIATSVQKEIEPTLKELQEAAKSINSIANTADEKFTGIKSGLTSVVGAGSILGGKLKSFSKGILKGIAFGLNLLKK